MPQNLQFDDIKSQFIKKPDLIPEIKSKNILTMVTFNIKQLKKFLDR